MRIALYSENLLKNSGGAEILTLLFANALSLKHDVFVIADKSNKVSVSDLFNKYGINAIPVVYVNSKRTKNPIWNFINNNFVRIQIKKIIQHNCNLFINCSCNRMAGIKGIKSIHYICFPAKNLNGKLPKVLSNYFNNFYVKSYYDFMIISKFSNEYLFKYWNKYGKLLYPAINMTPINENLLSKKENIILVVSRLVPDKMIMELIKGYKTMIQTNKDCDYKLVIIGNTDSNCMDYFEKLKASIDDYKIQILNDVNYKVLVEYYQKAKIFWHARGYLAENEDPFYMEHFGMTTVEAMANGCIPVVIGKAGQKEIIENSTVGFCWNNLDELLKYSIMIMQTEEKKLKQMQLNSIENSKKYLIDNFNKNALDIILQYEDENE